jgi:hypothetical protein
VFAVQAKKRRCGVKIQPLPESHYSPRVLAEIWGVSESTILRWFQDLEGVLKLGDESRNGKRVRREIRIPKSLAERVYEEKTR